MRQLAEAKISEIAHLSRDDLIEQLMHFPSRFRFDFTQEYLASLKDEQLRHMLMAAYMYAREDGDD